MSAIVMHQIARNVLMMFVQNAIVKKVRRTHVGRVGS